MWTAIAPYGLTCHNGSFPKIIMPEALPHLLIRMSKICSKEDLQILTCLNTYSFLQTHIVQTTAATTKAQTFQKFPLFCSLRREIKEKLTKPDNLFSILHHFPTKCQTHLAKEQSQKRWLIFFDSLLHHLQVVG